MPPRRDLDPKPAIAELRDRLGEYVAHVHEHGATVPVTVDGRPAGALAPTSQVLRVGLTVAGAASVDTARKQLARVRADAHEQGPQAITARSGAMAVLVSTEHARLIEQGLPVLAADELRFDGGRVYDQDGHPIAPGSYSYVGGVLHVPAPETTDEGGTL